MKHTQGISTPIIFTMKDSGGALEPNVSGISVELSKNGGSFATPAGTISEIGKGYYKLSATTANVDTVGPCKLYAWKAGTSIRGGTEYEVEPKVPAKEVWGGVLYYGGGGYVVTFTLLDSDGVPVTGASAGGITVQYRHDAGDWQTLVVSVYEVNGTSQGVYHFTDSVGALA